MGSFSNVFLKLIGTIAIVLGLFQLLIVASISLLFRRFVMVFTRIHRPDLAQMLSGMSQIFALESYQAESSCNLILYIVCDGTLSLDSLRQQFLIKLMPPTCVSNLEPTDDPYARLRQLWAKYMDLLFWQWEADFRVEKHIRYYDYSDNDTTLTEGGVCSEDDLKRIAAPLLAKPFVAGQSPWELLLIENYKSNENNDGHRQCVVAVRIHHALADGFSLVKMILRLFDNDTADFATAEFPQLSFAKRIRRNVLVALRGPYDLASKHFVDCYDSRNCWYMVDKQRPKEYHAFFSEVIQVGKIKEIMKKYSVCYNAAIYSITAGAIVKLMQEAGQKIPIQLSSFYSYPLPGHPGGLENYVSSDLFSFRPFLHASPADRLKHISKTVRSAREFSSVPIIMHWMGSLITLLPLKLMGHMYKQFHVTLCMTSVVGPRINLDLLGSAKLVELIPVLGHLRTSVGAMAVMNSVGTRQRIVLTVHRAIFDQYKLPCDFSRYVHEEIEDLLQNSTAVYDKKICV